ncbi:SDR family NAD(P)-dependent oxidoreductase [Reichenbachiella sp. 5M10]|uniref:SDR family NAD(P)-dependent oxidoreductase n=1 Tax=Reichenbachiella sp. 5M10 TaxID=1889772 RepID=UPI0021014F66|nr:SDR family NAD(P)-dependent oxidoreductase [Reichenbachiella sp. 5M10]
MQQGYYLYIGSRSIERGNLAIEKRKNKGVTNAESIHLDVNDTASVDKARIELGKKTDVLDALINNAGINGGMPQQALSTTIDQLQTVFDTKLVWCGESYPSIWRFIR